MFDKVINMLKRWWTGETYLCNSKIIIDQLEESIGYGDITCTLHLDIYYHGSVHKLFIYYKKDDYPDTSTPIIIYLDDQEFYNLDSFKQSATIQGKLFAEINEYFKVVSPDCDYPKLFEFTKQHSDIQEKIM